MKFRVFIIAVYVVLVGCKSVSTEEEKAVELSAFTTLKTFIDSRNLVFEAQVAFPFQTNDIIDVSHELMRQTENANGRFSLSANEDYLVIKRDSASAHLTYFGELRTAGYSASRDTHIEFNNLIRDYKIKINEKKRHISISFKVKNETEQFNVKLLLFSNQKGNLIVYGSNRTTIRYDGILRSTSIED